MVDFRIKGTALISNVTAQIKLGLRGGITVLSPYSLGNNLCVAARAWTGLLRLTKTITIRLKSSRARCGSIYVSILRPANVH